MSTPVDSGGHVDLARFTAHACSLIEQRCDIVTMFGTTGEGASFGMAERDAALNAFAKAGIAPDRTVVGVVAPTIEDAAAQSSLALDAGCRGVLLTPPYYYKGIGDDGLYAWYAAVFEKIGAKARGIILYHLPSMTAVPLSVELIGRLHRDFPKVVFGVKDSSGDWNNARRLLSAYANDLAILIGDERQLAAAVRGGGQGCISGLANIAPDLMQPLVREGREDSRVNALVDEIGKFPVLSAVKALIAHRTGDRGWMTMRAPLTALDAGLNEKLISIYNGIVTAKAA